MQSLKKTVLSLFPARVELLNLPMEEAPGSSYQIRHVIFTLFILLAIKRALHLAEAIIPEETGAFLLAQSIIQMMVAFSGKEQGDIKEVGLIEDVSFPTMKLACAISGNKIIKLTVK